MRAAGGSRGLLPSFYPSLAPSLPSCGAIFCSGSCSPQRGDPRPPCPWFHPSLGVEGVQVGQGGCGHPCSAPSRLRFLLCEEKEVGRKQEPCPAVTSVKATCRHRCWCSLLPVRVSLCLDVLLLRPAERQQKQNDDCEVRTRVGAQRSLKVSEMSCIGV